MFSKLPNLEKSVFISSLLRRYFLFFLLAFFHCIIYVNKKTVGKKEVK